MGTTLSYLKTLADIFMLMVHDRYHLLNIFVQLTKSGELINNLSFMMTEYSKMAEIEKSLGGIASSKVVSNRYCELLFKVITHQSGICREQFLKGKGVSIVKNILKTASSGS